MTQRFITDSDIGKVREIPGEGPTEKRAPHHLQRENAWSWGHRYRAGTHLLQNAGRW